jgi:hypothetical protein
MILLTAAVACGGLRASTSSPSARVEGLVVDADGEPASDVDVQIGQAIVATDADGRFAFEAVGAHYDVALTVKNTRAAYVFQDMSTRAPTLRLFDLALSPRSHETVVHAVLPEDAPLGAKVVMIADAPSESTRVVDVRSTEANDGGVDVAVRWIGEARALVSLHAIAYEADDLTLAPSRYLGVATMKDAWLEDGGTPPAWRMTYEPLRESRVDAHVAAPAGHAVEWTSLYVTLGPHARRAKLADRLGSDARVAYVVPDLPGATFSVAAFAHAGDAVASVETDPAIAGARGTLSLDLPRAPALRTPARGAKVASDTVLAWDPLAPSRALGGGEVSWVYFGAADQSSKTAPHVWIATPNHEAEVPDLRALGVDVRAQSGVWYVVSAAGATTVEEAAESGLFREGAGSGGNTAPWPYTVKD